MKILYHHPAPTTINAGRTIYFGYKHAFEDLGHEFYTFTQDDNATELFGRIQPDIFFTSLSPLNLKFLDLSVVKRHKKRGMKVFTIIPFWKSPMSSLRINETPSVSQNKEWVRLIQSGAFGDIYYNICEQDDPRMEGFEKTTGFKHHTVLLAADKTIIYPEYSKQFISDICYIGTYLPEKAHFFTNTIYPLKDIYDIKIYGQDWTLINRTSGFIQKIGQYFNIPILKNLRKPSLELSDERKIYTSSNISINIHENHQRTFGDLNERTFKIPLAGGFQIVDNNSSLKKYFTDGKDIVIAKNKKEWIEKIKYYIEKPELRKKMSEAGRKNVLHNHTYHHRVKQLLKIYKNII